MELMGNIRRDSLMEKKKEKEKEKERKKKKNRRARGSTLSGEVSRDRLLYKTYSI